MSHDLVWAFARSPAPEPDTQKSGGGTPALYVRHDA